MKQWLIVALLAVNSSGFAQFDSYFLDKTMRLDYYHSGNDKEEIFSFDELLEEPYWGGSKVNLIDIFDYGNYFVKIVNIDNDSVLYSRGYGSLFGEWQTTNEAKETWRTLSESVTFPYPKVPVRIELYSRSWEGEFEKKFEYTITLNNYFIKKDQRKAYPFYDVHISGDAAVKVDILILPEGYSEEEMGFFIEDCNKFATDFFAFAPYSENQEQFNIRAVLAPSKESGVDIPADTIWKSTIMNSGYYTFDSERYLMTFDNKSVRDLAANAPYDQIYILVNSDKYGGGAIYNYYNVSVNSNEQSGKILIHEFGHGFAGLADEYYDNSTSYGEFYNLEIEPWEPNITTLVNFQSKWKHLVKKRTLIPTPENEKYIERIGAFEGGGYEPKGMYRPMHDCMMKTFDGNVFCPACKQAIQNMIDFYSE